MTSGPSENRRLQPLPITVAGARTLRSVASDDVTPISTASGGDDHTLSCALHQGSGILCESKQNSANTFVLKLYKILEQDEYGHIVTWTDNGTAFKIEHVGMFTSKVIPRMFKHSNFASFVRQLNKYGFHKVSLQPLLYAVYWTNGLFH